MLRFVAALVAFVCLGSGAFAQELHSWGEGLGPIFATLDQNKSSGFLELIGHDDPGYLPTVPNFLPAATTANSRLQNLRKVAASVPGFHVSQTAQRMFLIKQKGVPDNILKVKIRHLTFKDVCFHEIYSANRALMIILQSPEVVAYATAHDIAVSPSTRGAAGISGGIGMGCGLRPTGLPRLSGSLDDVTVWQAFEKIFQAFPGEILVYWNFPKRRSENGAAGRHKKIYQTLPESYSQCHQSPGPDLPDPLCLPATALSALPALFSVQVDPPPQRRIRFWFFGREQFGNKTIITSG